MKEIVMGFLGGGNIGGCVYRLLTDMKKEIAERFDLSIRVKKVLVKDLESFIPNGIPEDLLVFDYKDVTEDPEITMVAEFMGGEHPAADFMLEALKHGKTAVTANKVALALNWDKLQAAAQANHCGLYYEASVGGAMPIIAMLNNSLQANRIDSMMSIINGTTNYILSDMSTNGTSYADSLAEAQRLGLAEPNPTFDVEGMDAAYKLSILSSLAFNGRVTYNEIYREGITKVSPLDISCGREMGYVLKLLAIAKNTDNCVETRVHPTFIPSNHPLASVNGSFNAVYLHGHSCEDMMLQGYGAGTPTASAVCSDIINAATADKHAFPYFDNTATACPAFDFTSNWVTRFFIRLSVVDEPGVLAHVAECFGREGISIATMMQKKSGPDKRVPLILITHAAYEQSMQTALSHLDPSRAEVGNVIRVEE